MRSVLRTAVIGVTALAATAVPAAPASADDGGEFHGVAYVDCHGCGPSQGHADLTFSGTVDGRVVLGPATAEFTLDTPTGPMCMLRGAAAGRVTGAVNLYFNWSRVGSTAVITTTGDVTGSGTVAVVPRTTGFWCGGPAEFEVHGTLAGP